MANIFDTFDEPADAEEKAPYEYVPIAPPTYTKPRPFEGSELSVVPRGLYGVGASVAGAVGARDTAANLEYSAQAIPRRFNSWRDIDPLSLDVIDYVQQVGAEQIAPLGLMAVGAAPGALLKSTTLARAGGMAASSAMEYGGMVNELQGEGIKPGLGTAVLGLAAGAADVMGLESLGRSILQGSTRAAAQAGQQATATKHMLRSVGKGLAEGLAAELPAEEFQAGAEIANRELYDPGYIAKHPEEVKQRVEEPIAQTLAFAGTLGAGSGAYKGFKSLPPDAPVAPSPPPDSPLEGEVMPGAEASATPPSPASGITIDGEAAPVTPAPEITLTPGPTHEEANQASTNETTEQGQKPSPLLTGQDEYVEAPSVSSTAARPAVSTAQPRTHNLGDIPYAQHVQDAAEAYGLDPYDLAAIMHQESRGHQAAVSPKGAAGLMQLMPETAKEMGVTDPFDPRQNIFGGARYYYRMLKRYGGNKALALAAYNAGPARVNLDGSGAWRRIPETVNYVNTIMRHIEQPGWSPRMSESVQESTPRSSLGSAVTSGQTRSLDPKAHDEETTDVTAEAPVFEDMSNASIIGQSYDSDGHELIKDAAVSENPNVFRTIISGDEGDTKYSGSRVSKAFSAIFPNSVTAQKTSGPTLYHVNLDLDRASARTDADVERLQQALNTSMTDEGVDITDRMAQYGRLVRRAKAILEAIAGADKSDPKSKLMFLHDAVRGDKDPEKHVEVGMTRAGLAQLGRAVSDEQYDNTPQGDYDAAVDGAAYWLTQGFRPANRFRTVTNKDGVKEQVRVSDDELMRGLLGERPATKPLWDSMDALHDPDHPDPHGARRPGLDPRGRDFEGPVAPRADGELRGRWSKPKANARTIAKPLEGPPRQQTAAERGFAWDEFSHPEFADPISEEERIAMRLEDLAGLGFEGPVRPTEGGKGKWKKPKSKIRDHLSFLEQEHSPIQRALLRELVKRAKPLLPSIKERYPEAYPGEKRILHETVAYRQAAVQLRKEGLDKISAGEHAATPRDLNDTVRIALHEIKTYEREKERSDAKAAAAEERGDSSVELRIKPEGEDRGVQTLSEQGARLEDAEQEKRITQIKRDADRLRKKITRLKEADAKAREAKVAEIEADKRIAPEYKQDAIRYAMDTLDMEYSRKVELMLAGREFEEVNLIDYFNELKQHVSRPRVEGEELITTPDRDVTQPLMLLPNISGNTSEAILERDRKDAATKGVKIKVPTRPVPVEDVDNPVLGNELRAVTGSVLATNVPRSLAMIVNDVLHHIGLNIQTRMISRGSIQAHIDALTEQRRDLYQRTVFASHALARAKRGTKTKFQADLRRAERNLRELDYEIGKLREAQDNPTWLFRAIYNDHYTLAENRVPIILVGDIGDRPVNLLPAALAHEVGHVVQRAWFDQLKPEDQAGIVKELMGEGQVDPDMLAEAFANRFAEWYATRRKLQTTSNAARKAGKWGRLEQAFHDFHDMLKRVWETIRTMGARFADVQKTMLDGLDPKDPADRAVLLRAEAAEFAAKYPTFNEFLSTMVGFGGNMPDARLWKNPRWRQLVFDPILAMPAQQRVKWPSSNAELVAAAGDTEAGAFAEYEAEEGAQPEATQPSTPSAPSPRAEVPADVADIVKRGKELLPGILARTAPASHHDMSIDEFDQRVRQAASAAAARAQRYASGTRVAQSAVVADYKKRFKGTWDAMARIGRTVFQADGTRLRNLADGRFAGVGNIIAPPMGKRMDQIQLRAIPLRRENGVVIGTTRIFAPLHDLIGMERRRLREKYHVFPLLNEIIELHQQDQAAYDDLLENLWDEQAPTRSALAQKIRTFYKDILKELVAAGISFDATPGPNANDPTHGPTKLKIAEREGYFTKMPDIDKMLAEPDEVIEAFTKAYQARLDKGQELPENEHGIPYATAREAAEAQHYRTVTGNYDDVFTDLQQQKETGLRGPAFPQARSRPFSNEEYQQFGLTRWLERDIAKVISTYLDTSARRAATQRAFGFPLQIRNNDRASAALKERFRLARLDPSLMHTPTAAIELLIHEAERDGLLNRDGVKEVYTLIRSALGQLNVGRSPRGRRWMNRLVALETLNTMSGSALMQLSDFGINLWRGENLPRDLGNLAKLFDGTTREQQRRILEMLGMAADHMAQHAYLTDIGTTNDPLAEGSRKVTEFMFKYNGMQKLSEYSMMLASIIGQDYMRDYARQATNATLPQAQRDKALGRLKELHPDLTPDDVLNGDLENDIRPDRRIRLRYALRRYINTSHIHDQHGYTSQIFNDWRFKPLTMLKGFMMKFHNIVLKLMWERMKEQPDLRHAVMPFVTLAICTMPLAAMGLYAKDLLRRKAPEYVGRMFGQRWTTKRKHKDRTPEQWIHDSFMATGMGGMYLGVMDSMYEAPQHGMPALVALGGPPITHGYTMMTRTADEWVPASIPGLNIFPAAKSGLRSELRDTFGWGVRDDEE